MVQEVSKVRILLLFVSVAFLTISWTGVRAQENLVVTCLPAAEIQAILTERGGETWRYSRVEQELAKQAECVTRSMDRLTFRQPGGLERHMVWVGSKQFGHWYLPIAVQTGFDNLRVLAEGGKPPATVLRKSIPLEGGNRTLLLQRYLPACPCAGLGQANIEYLVAVSPPRAQTNAQWSAVFYSSSPSHGPDGSLNFPGRIYDRSQLSDQEINRLQDLYLPALIDSIEAKEFERKAHFFLGNAIIPGVGLVAVRANATKQMLPNPPPPLGDTESEFNASDRISLIIAIAPPRPLTRTLVMSREFRVMADKVPVYGFKRELSLQADAPMSYAVSQLPSRLTAGTYTIQWLLNDVQVASVVLVLR